MRSRAVALVREHPLLTPLLLAYGAVALLAGMFENGIVFAPLNLVLVAGYLALIHFATGGSAATSAEIQGPVDRRRDIALAVSVTVLQFAGVTVAWFVFIRHGWRTDWSAHLTGAGVPQPIAGKVVNDMLTVPLLLVPTLVAVVIFRVGARDVGLAATPRHLLLGLLLAAISVGVGAGASAAGTHPVLLWQSSPLPIAAVTMALQAFSNGLPEELAYRGVIFGRLMPWLGRPGNSLVVSTVVWSLSHVPSLVVGSGLPVWLAIPIGLLGPNGLLWGYLYYRTRSIWPGVMWHTAISGIGTLFF